VHGPTRRRAAFAAIAACVLAVAVPGVAGAHVTVHPDRLRAGAHDALLVFRCPNERSDASTVELQVFLPTDTPLLGVLTSAVPGWTSRVTTVTLAHPVATDDGSVDQSVDEVAWRATGAGVAPGQFQDFAIDVGSLPGTAGPLVFKALQTYSNGEVVRWIQVADSLNPTPSQPAPVLTLTAARAPATASTPVAATTIAIAALLVALLAALFGALALMRRRGA